MGDTPRHNVLAAECQVFCRYLVERDAPDDILAAYDRAHEKGVVGSDGTATALDRALLRVARTGPILARAADAFAVTFAKPSLLRKKLVLLLAILESRGSTAAILDTATPGPRVVEVAVAGLHVARFVVTLCLASLLIVPLRIWYRVVDRPCGT